MANNAQEPSSAPKPDKWYSLRLGSSFRDNSSSKFCTLRYEFKPASIDRNQAGLLHKNKDNRVTVEFQNNQPGKPKVTFEGSSEDYKDNDAVLFFDGETFRLERLHRSVKRLRHVRLPGESAAAAANLASAASAGTATESRSPPLGKVGKAQAQNKAMFHAVPLEVERIDVGEPESPGPRANTKSTGMQLAPANSAAVSPGPKSYEPDEDLDILGDDDTGMPNTFDVGQTVASGFDINIPHQNYNDEEIADIDGSDDGNEGPNIAEALHSQVNGEGEQQETSSSSGSSGSDSSGSGSGSGSDSSSSDSDDGSDNDSASSGGDIDVC